MRSIGAVVCAIGLLILSQPASSNGQAVSDHLIITSARASTWVAERTSIIEVQTPVTIDLQGATMTADAAVVWLTDPAGSPGGTPGPIAIQIALIGNAELKQPDLNVTRSGDRLLISASVRGTIRFVGQRQAEDGSQTELYVRAAALRFATTQPLEVVVPPPASGPATQPAATNPAAPAPGAASNPPETGPSNNLAPPGSGSAELPDLKGLAPQTGFGRAGRRAGNGAAAAAAAAAASTQPQLAGPFPGQTAATRPAPPPPNSGPVFFNSNRQDYDHDAEGRLAIVLSGNVQLFQPRAGGDFLEMQADNVVLFTFLGSMNDLDKLPKGTRLEDCINGIYLDGDVRIDSVPAGAGRAEQRMTADRVYYELATDRAILTHAVIHTMELKHQIPMILRAQTIRQLSTGEYEAPHVTMTTSSFATPSYSIESDRVYVRQVQTGDPDIGTRTDYVGYNDVLTLFGLPVFYWPKASGSISEQPFPLRSADLSDTSRNGVGIATNWGIFESAGLIRPQGLDASLEADYFDLRGPAMGIDADYNGGFITQTTRQPWDFTGDLKSYFVLDHGFDVLGSQRTDVTPNQEMRGRVLWEHEHYFPDDWQVQIRLGYETDPTFREYWFRDEFDDELPLDASAYFKRQRDSEAITLLTEADTTSFITNAEHQQEQVDVERLPELGYHRIGDSLANDQLTNFFDASLANLRFEPSHASLADQGFVGISPGLPAEGITGTSTTPDIRGDVREEIDDPFSLGQFRVMPYVMGRVTSYSNTPEGNSKDRFMEGAGVRLTTDFWKVDDTVSSDLFDLHRLRHIIEPEINLFTSVDNVDSNQLFIYDEPVDAINDISAAQIALHQYWQTQRGGPDKWRSVDVFTLDLEADLYANKPKRPDLAPENFRGLFFDSLPEASIPRDAINGDAIWRVSDTTALLSDAEWNADDRVMETAAIGAAVQRDPRIGYYAELRYIEPLDSDIASVYVSYQITKQYSLGISQSYDFGSGKDVTSALSLTRQLDRLLLQFSIYDDAVTGISGFRLNLVPEGLVQRGAGAGDIISNVFAPPH